MRSETELSNFSSEKGISTEDFARSTNGNTVELFEPSGSMVGGVSAVSPCFSAESGTAELDDTNSTSAKGAELSSALFPADVKGEPSLRQKFSASLK
jgi:hypothetical protein